tara:strand:+ start:8381 stop:9493 length:1113 start_codon:yes stop_codon:yes gene_type:complete
MFFSYSKFKRISGKSLLIFFLIGFINPVIANKSLIGEQEKIEVNNNDIDDLQTNSYILGPGDVIGLKLFDMPELKTQISILQDSTSSFPLIGTVDIDNLTIKQAEKKLTILYKKEIIDPIVTLEVIRPRPARVTLIGEVQRPGYYSLTTNESSGVEGKNVSISGLPTIVDALKKAGGVTPYANLTNIKVRRRLPGKKLAFKEAKVDILSLFEVGNIEQNLFLFDDDVITIEKANFSAEEISRVSKLNLSPDFISVNVVGEVKYPGLKRVSANASLSEVLLAAGGTLPVRARNTNIEVIRFLDNGAISKKSFKFKKGQKVSNKKNPPLMDRDIVFVNSSIYGKTTDTLEVVTKPLQGVINLYGLLKIIKDF